MKGRITKNIILALFLIGSLASNSFINHNLVDSNASVNIEVEMNGVVDSDQLEEEQSTSFKVLDLRYINAIIEKITEIVNIL